jgi:hypothetical protein
MVIENSAGTKKSTFEKYKNLAIKKIEAILEKLDIEYSLRNDYVEILCPIHNGSRVGNSIIYYDTGVWICFTKNCHKDHGSNILSLIKACMEKNSNNEVSWHDVYNFIDSEERISNVRIIPTEERQMFFDEKTMPPKRVPSLYYISRGYKESSLVEYDVGDCVSGFCVNKAIVPIRYINEQYMGYSARSHWKKCGQCSYYHSRYETCISKNHDFRAMYNKWFHSKGLQKSKTLYGINKIKNTDKVALVEGPGCVWKLYEHGILAVSVLGKDIDKNRINILKDIGIKNVLFIPDNDEAGIEFKKRFIMSFHDDIGIHVPKITEKDVGDMSDEDIKRNIVSKWEKI